jgi:hypothetical protein
MKRPKIWKTEDEIIAAIDRTRRMANRKLKKSQELAEVAKSKFARVDALSWELFNATRKIDDKERTRLENNLKSSELSAAEAKERADICAKAYHRAINSTLPRLGEILSAFRTQPMTELVGDYRGVALR